MTSTVLSMTRFRELAAAYGGNVDGWPAREREAARRLLASSEEAQALLREETSLDTLLQAVSPPPLSAELQRRLASIPTELPRVRPRPLARKVWWAPALGWAAAASVGLWLGVSRAESDGTSTQSVESAEALPPGDEEADDVMMSEVLALASGSVGDLEELP